MNELPIEIERIESDILTKYLLSLKLLKKKHIMRNELLNFFNDLRPKNLLAIENSESLYVYKFLRKSHELIILDNKYYVSYRYHIAKYDFYKIEVEHDFSIQSISIEEYMRNKDIVITGKKEINPHFTQIDFMPFYDYAPTIKDSNQIGNGINFLTRHLASNLFQNAEKWNQLLFDFISIHSLQKKQLLINSKKIKSIDKLIEYLNFMIDLAAESVNKKKERYFFVEMKKLGFEPGWGSSINKIRETMLLLIECFNSPDSTSLENFISRIPMISKIAILSPHGWFGQDNVLGRPDTGGQVVYILDQVKYLEKHISSNLKEAGLSNVKPKILIVTRLIPENEGTKSNIRIEKVKGTGNCHILRIPFRKKDGTIHRKWVSRFHIWPYLEDYAVEVEKELTEEFGSQPDLLIGNYSDGNLVASFISKKTGVMQCNIAHALEKSKYLFSDMQWEDFEYKYNFSFQFTADLIAMNLTSFIITSTFQEIGGTKEAQGQYESYLTYSMPDLYHVKRGINLFHPKFNVIPPGVPENIFFSHKNYEQRKETIKKKMERIVFYAKEEYIFGELENQDKKPIFSMARIDKIKNLSGLIESYGSNKELIQKANLILITDKVSFDQSKDQEEKKEMKKMYDLIKKYKLQKHMRWVGIGASSRREELAEVYRIMADKRGVFVQPAFFEAFGLTILEAMGSGLPTFATKFGGPSEIIFDEKNGFLINPTVPDSIARKILWFITKSEKEGSYWEKISESACFRIKDCFNWDLHSDRLLTLTRLYGFWKFAVSLKAKEKMSLYCDLLYDDFYRKRLPEY
ncbi:MAG: sucrose synthase [bacterium]|nr:sucrose synthase [bacterium]